MASPPGNLKILGLDEPREDEKFTEEEFKGDEVQLILYFFKKELDEISCKSLIRREPDTGSAKRLVVKYGENKAEAVKILLDKLKSKLKDLSEKEVTIPRNKTSELAEFVKEYEGNEDVLVLTDITSDNVNIVGRTQDQVETAAHKLKVKTGQLSTTSGRFKGQDSDPSGSSGIDSILAGSKEQEGKGKRLYPNLDSYKKKNSLESSSYDHSGNSASYGKNSFRGSSSGKASSYRSSSSDGFKFEMKLKGGLVLKVYKASITRLSVDAIVNAANDTMMHGGGVARVISEAAGYRLDKESADYVDRRGQVKVSENIVTTAGKLPYKGVIHAVGPMWHDYSTKNECLQDLYECVFKILTRCEQRQFRTVGMSAISAGIFAVPKELCADMYVKAAVDFSEKLGDGKYTYPKELHIIDVDESILHLVKASVEKWQRNPSSIELDVTLSKYLKDNPHILSYPGTGNNSSYRGRRRRGHGSGQGQTTESYGNEDETNNDSSRIELKCKLKRQGKESLSWGGSAQIYDYDGQIKVKIFKGSIEKTRNMDAIICGTDKSLQARGFIADALKTSGGQKFKDSFKRMVDKNKYSAKTLDVYKCDYGNLGVKKVVYIVMERVVYVNKNEVEKYEMAVKNILEKAREWELGRVVIPMFGTGTIQSNKNNLRKCCIALLKGIDSFLDDRGNKAKVTEIHLVNKDVSVCEVLEEVFNEGADILPTARANNNSSSTASSTHEDMDLTSSDDDPSNRNSRSRRTYTADGQEKGANLQKSKGQSSSYKTIDFSRSQGNKGEGVHRSSSRSDSQGLAMQENASTETGEGTDEEPHYATINDALLQQPSDKPKPGNLNIIDG